MNKHLRPTLALLILLTLTIGGIYPGIVWVIGQSLFPFQSNGSLIQSENGHVIGSKLLAQDFSQDHFFWSRPRTIEQSTSGFLVSGARNLNPSNPKLIKATEDRVAYLWNTHVDHDNEAIASDLALASASGLDPHISPEAALFQAKRVAKARGVAIIDIEKLIHKHTLDKTFGFIGQRRVNVLMLNIALKGLSGGTHDK